MVYTYNKYIISFLMDYEISLDEPWKTYSEMYDVVVIVQYYIIAVITPIEQYFHRKNKSNDVC